MQTDNTATVLTNQGWTPVKPKIQKECILLTANFYNKRWNYSSWLIEKLNSDEGWYWGWLTIDGDEYGDINDLSADLYKTVSIIPKNFKK